MLAPITISIENAIANYLEGIAELDNTNIVAHSSIDEAPNHPCIIVHCQQVSRMDDTTQEMYAKSANVTASLYFDDDDGASDLSDFEDASRELECALEDIDSLKDVFNYDPLADPDLRPVTGLHLHAIDEFQTDNDTEDRTWQFGVGLTLHVEEVDEA